MAVLPKGSGEVIFSIGTSIASEWWLFLDHEIHPAVKGPPCPSAGAQHCGSHLHELRQTAFVPPEQTSTAGSALGTAQVPVPPGDLYSGAYECEASDSEEVFFFFSHGYYSTSLKRIGDFQVLSVLPSCLDFAPGLTLLFFTLTLIIFLKFHSRSYIRLFYWSKKDYTHCPFQIYIHWTSQWHKSRQLFICYGCRNQGIVLGEGCYCPSLPGTWSSINSRS